MRTVTDTYPYSPSSISPIPDDIAVLAFSGGLPSGYGPVTLAGGTILGAGTALVQAGYGTTTPHSDGSDRGILRSVNNTIDSLDGASKEIHVGTRTPGHATCSGDSGGPDFVSVHGELRQIGVHSGSDCATGSINKPS